MLINTNTSLTYICVMVSMACWHLYPHEIYVGMYAWMDGWMDGYMNACMYVCILHYCLIVSHTFTHG